MSKLRNALKEAIKRKLLEESNNILTANIGGARYQFSRNGSIKRLGSEEMDYGSAKLIGATTFYGNGNRHFTKGDVEISLQDIFNNPDSFVGTFPLILMDGQVKMVLGGYKESDNKVLWVK